jgi:hypothetical protein
MKYGLTIGQLDCMRIELLLVSSGCIIATPTSTILMETRCHLLSALPGWDGNHNG